MSIENMFEIIKIVVIACLLLLIFSDGIAKGFRIIMFLLFIFVFPMFFIVYYDSSWAGVIGLIAGLIIWLTIEMLFDRFTKIEGSDGL